jgi:hypothetical protein
MIDLYVRAPSKEALLADLAPLGLVQDGGFVTASPRHALLYIGQIAQNPGTLDTAGLQAAPPERLPGVYALLRCDAALAGDARRAAFARGTALVDRPPGAPVFAGDGDQALDAVKAAACAAIDAEAERRRMLLLTPGAGQALEYQHTAEEAARADAAPDPLDPVAYPFLAAEQQALLATVGEVSLRDVALAVLTDRAAWLAYGAAIKAARRRAKLMIREAGDAAGVAAAAAGAAWPDLPTP